MVITQPAFLNEIPQEHLLFSVDETGKKQFDKRCFNKGFTREQVEALKQDNQEIGVMYYIKDTNYVVVDIDSNDYSVEDLFNDSDIDSCYVKGNTKGHHIWCCMKDKTDEFKKNKVDCGNHATIDFLGEKVFERIGKEWTHDDACFLHDHQVEKCFKQNTFVKAVRPTSNCSSENDKTIIKLIDLIDKKYCDDRLVWIKLVLAMKKSKLDFSVADNWSKKSQKYDYQAVETTWNSYEIDAITSTIGTIKWYAKKSSPQEYENVIREDARFINIIYLQSLEADKALVLELPSNFEDFATKVKADEKEKVKKSVNEWINATYRLKKKYFEKFVAKVNKPAVFVRFDRDEAFIIQLADLKHIYGSVNIGREKFIDMWLNDVYARCYENINFLPPPKHCGEETYNTYIGLRASRLKGGNANFDLFLEHIKILCGNDDVGAEYLINYLAHSVQKVGELPLVALVFQSEPGVGKNVFFEGFVNSVFGKEYLLQTADIDKVIGRFPMISSKLYIIMDETNGKDSFSNSDKIKNIITADSVAFEKKGVDGTTINNCGRYLFFSNNLTPVKIENHDRRYVVFKCANDRKGDRPYFNKMLDMFKDDNVVKSFYDFLMARDISNWSAPATRPITDAYNAIKEANIPAMATYLYEEYCKYEYAELETKTDMSKRLAMPFFTQYQFWLNKNGWTKTEITSTKFGREMVSYEGITKSKTRDGMVYTIDYDTLKEFLKSKGVKVY